MSCSCNCHGQTTGFAACNLGPADGGCKADSQLHGSSMEQTDETPARRLCMVCTRNDLDLANPIRLQTCTECEARTKRTLAELIDALALLPYAYTKSGSPMSDKVRGSTEPAMPGGDALVVLGPAREIKPFDYDKDGTRNLGHLAGDIWHDDDPEPAVSALCGWEDDWRAMQDPPHPPRPAEAWESPGTWDNGQLGGNRAHIARVIMSAFRYLSRHNHWAAEEHPAYDEYAAHLMQLRDRVERILHADTLIHRLPARCVHCDGQLVRNDGADKVRCRRCHRNWPEAEYRHMTLTLASEAEEKGTPVPDPRGRARRTVVHGPVRQGAGFTLCRCGWQGHSRHVCHVWTEGDPPTSNHLPSEAG